MHCLKFIKHLYFFSSLCLLSIYLHTIYQSFYLIFYLYFLIIRYSVHNFREFVDFQKFTISENEILVSFGVVSLFTSVFMDMVLKLVLELLVSVESLFLLTSLDISDITIGLKHCFFLLYFRTETLYSNRSLALLWVLASLPLLLLFTRNMSSIQLLQHFTSHVLLD